MKFQSGAWTQALPDLAIFDQVYVAENVYLGDGVGLEQKRNLYKLIVGQQAVAKALRLEQLVADIRAIATPIRDANKAVSSHLVGSLKFQELIDTQPDPDIDTKITQAEADLRDASATAIMAKSIAFQTVQIPAQPAGIVNALAETLASVSVTADQELKAHLARHNMKSGDQGWLAQGLDFQPDAGCPFCGQDITGLPLVEAYKVIFSAGYKGLKDRVIALGKTVAEAFKPEQLQILGSVLEEIDRSIEFWKPFTSFVPPEAPTRDEALNALNRYREELLRLLRQKAAAPLELVERTPELVEADAEFEVMAARLREYNLMATDANAAVKLRQDQLKLTNPEELKAKLELLHLKKKRFEPQLKGLCDKYIKLASDKVAMEKERDGLKAELDLHSGDVVERYRLSINRYLDLFNAGFSIAKVDHNYVGGVNASYQLLINSVQISLGDDKTPIGQPSFKNTLSAGDKSTLALALFLAQLDHDPDKAKRIVVLDDPFNSQDSFRRNQTAIEIVRMIPAVAQVVVLSHDARFLKELSDKAIGVTAKTLKLNPVGEKTEICALDLEDMLRAEVHVFINILQTYFRGGGGKPNDVVQKIRPLLEAYCKNSCITLFEPTDILSGILTKIRTTGASHPLSSIYADLNDINDYTCRHHHADGSVTGPIDETELGGYAKRTLRIVGAM